ncbi:hypothetical protein GGR02_003384 [Anoxybacillus voinovskiensis]|uniref:Uncharacterized protein n=1 Tax=Anoxybacteroides voinovskiense TaxID=230470 RepID=A0A840DVE5_9BACL|nr:hypothetical protein [Anoxybacillus voinovskiensis]
MRVIRLGVDERNPHLGARILQHLGSINFPVVLVNALWLPATKHRFLRDDPQPVKLLRREKLRVRHKPRAVIDIGDPKRFLGFPVDSNRGSMGSVPLPKLMDLVIRKTLSLRHGQDFFPDKVVFFQQSVYSKVRGMVF